jgi:hypothetical protein
MTELVKFECDFCHKKLVVERQIKKKFQSIVENKKCQPDYNTVQDLYNMFHSINGTPVNPSANLMYRKCCRILETLAVKLVEAKTIYVNKTPEPVDPLTTDHTYHKTGDDTGKQQIIQ